MDFSFLEDENQVITKEQKTFIGYFVQNTTEKIFRRIGRLGVSHSIAKDIHAVIYNNAGGNMPLVRFYYTNIARFIELGVGRSFMSDMDLGGEGVKAVNVNIPEITSNDYGPLQPSFHGTTNRGIAVTARGRGRAGNDVDRSKYHKARPFFMNTIKQEVRRISERMATQLAYTHTFYISKGLSTTTLTEAIDEQWRKNLGLLEKLRLDMHAQHIPALEH